MISPNEVKSKTFETVKNGYDIAAVDAFLNEAALALEETLNDGKDSEEKIIKLVEKINEYREEEDAIKMALLTAQKEANRILNESKASARDMIESAKTEQVRLSEQSAAECERIVREHKDKCAALIKENTEATEKKIIEIRNNYAEENTKYERLKAEVTYFKSNLTELYNKQLHLIMDIPEMPEEELEEYENAQAVEETIPEDVVQEYNEAVVETDTEKMDEILNTGSFEPVIPKNDVSELRFGKNN